MTTEQPTRRPRRFRSNKLTNWRMQLKLTGWFVGAGLFALSLQYILTVNALTQVAMENAVDPAQAFDTVTSESRRVFLVSAMSTLALMTVIGILATARLAGPLYRLRRFLEEIIRGEAPPDCRLRKGDELIDFCELLNKATASARQRPAVEEDERAA